MKGSHGIKAHPFNKDGAVKVYLYSWFLFLSIFLVVAPASLADGDQVWNTSTLDSTEAVGWYTSIAVDSNNGVHISYYDITNSDLKYGTNASGDWVFSTLDSTGDVGRSTSIAIDSNNKVHIAYYDNTNSDLKYATNASGNWVLSTVDSTGDVGRSPSLAIDSNNNVHISYYDNTSSDLKYATNTSGNWVLSTVDAEDVGGYTSIAVDSNDKVHISYWTGDLKYATNVSDSWELFTVDDTGDVGWYTSIAVDSNDHVHISYYDYTNSDLKYATNASGIWVPSTLDSAGDVGEYTSIAIGLNDRVHISYFDGTNGDLKYATNASGTWMLSTVDSTGVVGLYSSIAIDLSGNSAHISYFDFSNDDLKSTYRITPLNDSTEFVRQQYRDFLNREADPVGLQYWVDMIDTETVTRAQVIASFLHSEEFGGRVAPMVRLYFAYFLRIPDYGGLTFWINAYNSGWSLQAISDFFAASDEFQQRYGSLSNGQFVMLVYQNILGRAPDAEGYAYWVDQLDSGAMTRGQVMIGFSESAEYQELMRHEVFVTMTFVGMLRRSPDPGGFDYWVAYLDSGNSESVIIDGFLTSHEYANRF